MATPLRWKKRPEGSTWGDFGDDDQLGRLNLLTPENVRRGVAGVQESIRSWPSHDTGGLCISDRVYRERRQD